jgi:hypothetical protein
VVASDQRFAYFGTAAFAVRLLRLDQKIASGVPMSLKRVANVLNTDAMLFQEFCDRLSKYGDRTLTLFGDGQAVEVPVFFEGGGRSLFQRGVDRRELGVQLAADAVHDGDDGKRNASGDQSIFDCRCGGLVDPKLPN